MTDSTKTQIYRASWVLPVSSPPLENGEIVVENGRLLEVRPSQTPHQNITLDFPDAVLMPGLVNVHTHLDYTVMRGLLEDIDFFPWVRELNFRKSALNWDDWLASATWGAAEAVAGGVTTIGECTDSGAAFYGAKTLGLGGIIYQEVFGIDELRSVAEIMQELADKVANLQRERAGTLLHIGISPHAPYTVRPALFQALNEYARESDLPVCIHAAESRAEGELLRSGKGTIAEMFTRRGIVWEPPGKSTVAYLDSFGILGPKTMLVHGVQVSAADRHTVIERGAGWAHCPKSNAKLGNGVAPFGILSNRPLPHEPKRRLYEKIGLGSDSVASNNTMDMFEEMRFAVLMQRGARHRIHAMSAQEAVDMATFGGARTLGMDSEIGSLEAGKRADFCVVQLNDLHTLPAYDPYNALVYSARASDVTLTVIDGEICYDARLEKDRRFPGVNLLPVRENLLTAARKMRDWRPVT